MSVTDSIKRRVKSILNNPDAFSDLVDAANAKLGKGRNSKQLTSEALEKLRLLRDMISQHFRGEYKAFSRRTLWLALFGLVYFVTPTDAIPDFLVGIGFIDDLSVLYGIYNTLSADIEQYMTWRQNQSAGTSSTQ